MEDPAAAARDELGHRVEGAWGGSPRPRRSREGLLVALFIVIAAGAIWWTVQRADEAAGGDPAARPVVVIPGDRTDRTSAAVRACISRADGDPDTIMACIR